MRFFAEESEQRPAPDYAGMAAMGPTERFPSNSGSRSKNVAASTGAILTMSHPNQMHVGNPSLARNGQLSHLDHARLARTNFESSHQTFGGSGSLLHHRSHVNSVMTPPIYAPSIYPLPAAPASLVPPISASAQIQAYHNAAQLAASQGRLSEYELALLVHSLHEQNASCHFSSLGQHGLTPATIYNSMYGNVQEAHANRMALIHGGTGTNPSNPLTSPEFATSPLGNLLSPRSLALPQDGEILSEYQCLVRKQIEAFDAQQEDVESHARGRNKPIVLGQMGIRCKHCHMLPLQKRERGSVYFPSKLLGLYQAAQNMASCHLCDSCPKIPQELKDELNILRARKSTIGGGKQYWADAAKEIQLVDSDDRIRFDHHDGFQISGGAAA